MNKKRKVLFMNKNKNKCYLIIKLINTNYYSSSGGNSNLQIGQVLFLFNQVKQQSL